jgi:predicted HicB family RNase H-like nuclease
MRLSGGDVSFIFGEEPSASDAPPDEDDLSARITLRLPDRLKSSAEASAASAGLSLNAWLIRSVKAAIDRRPGTRGFKGYARS